MIVFVSQTKLPDSSNPLSDIVGAVQLSNNDVREYAPLQSAKTSLTQAMQTVSSSLKSQVVEAEFDTENGQPVYEIKVNKNGEEHKAYVDVNTGKILKTERD